MEYAETVYVNFDSNSKMTELFSADLDPERIIQGIEIYTGKKISSEDTLIIFDEIQEVPKALSSLKYFYEDASEYHIISSAQDLCWGSLYMAEYLFLWEKWNS